MELTVTVCRADTRVRTAIRLAGRRQVAPTHAVTRSSERARCFGALDMRREHLHVQESVESRGVEFLYFAQLFHSVPRLPSFVSVVHFVIVGDASGHADVPRPRVPLYYRSGLQMPAICHYPPLHEARGETPVILTIRHESLACSTTLGYAASIVIYAPFSPFTTCVTQNNAAFVRAGVA